MLIFVYKLRREEILDVLKRVYYVKKQKNVPIFYATCKDLREFTTTEKDMKKDIGRFPTPNYRTAEEDLFDEDPSASPSMMSQANSETGGFFDKANTAESDLAS